ncbi:MmgE/PrpD family protein [Bradyrhizobium embrapense]|uniref:MmgE/PrpD family protein n=1 Tax=Bradyrhizobium embrapense TaxID=630921 RepID=UPI00067DDBD0|nr:MmgE/PrpD family protein [Bradyrhizobium embrapense]
MAEITAKLAKFFSSIEMEQVPHRVQREARRCILDTLGCIYAGGRAELGSIIRSSARLFGVAQEASIAGEGKRFTGLAASYGNGRLANCLDLDETYPGGQVTGIHIAGSVVAEALATCEQLRLTSRELVLGAVCGYEVAGRIADVGTQMEVEGGRVKSMPEIYGFGFEATVGAAAATARLLGQSETKLEQTFAVAASNAALSIGPVWAKQTATPNTKYVDSGWAAMTGGFAARSVESGSTALPAIFDGSPNILNMAGSKRSDPDALIGELGSRWALSNITYKPWPSCRYLHHPLSALRRIRQDHHFDVRDVESIAIGANISRLSPRWLDANPQDVIGRQFSIPHSVAMLLLDVPTGIEWESNRWASDALAKDLRAKVTYLDYPKAATSPEYFVRGQYRNLPCFIEVRLRDRTLRQEAEFAWGDPWSDETRFNDEDIVTKFRSVSGLSTAAADMVIETVMEAELGASLAPVFEAMSLPA